MSLPLLCRKVPTSVLGQTDIVGRVAAAAKVGDQWGCRKTASISAAIPGKHRRVGQQQSHRALGAASLGIRDMHVPLGISRPS